jgi:hypothetical protein
MLVSGHLMVAVVDKVPDLNFEPICREAAGESLGIEDKFDFCIRDESRARDELAKQWSEFESADRMSCIRLSTMDRAASYVEVLTCLEMDQAVKKLHQRATAATAAADATGALGQAPKYAPDKINPPIRSAGLSRPPAPVLSPPPKPPPTFLVGLLQLFCLPGLNTILPACISGAGH